MDTTMQLFKILGILSVLFALLSCQQYGVQNTAIYAIGYDRFPYCLVC